MYHVPLVELTEYRRGRPSVVMTITAGTARRLLLAAKAKWSAEDVLQAPSLFNPQATRQSAVTIMVSRMRTLGDGRAIPSTLARYVLTEIGGDASRIGEPAMSVNTEPARRVFTPR